MRHGREDVPPVSFVSGVATTILLDVGLVELDRGLPVPVQAAEHTR